MAGSFSPISALFDTESEMTAWSTSPSWSSATPLSKALVFFLRIILMFSAFTRHFGLFFDDSLHELSVDLRTGNGQYVHSATRAVSMQATALLDDIVLISVWGQRLAGWLSGDDGCYYVVWESNWAWSTYFAAGVADPFS
ncbi:hypothetical protein B0T26DRAFT_110185 [Lasiosphaeria miniovina]|uniref:Uncharacterized protein n=1 Tax=Lasiosphaeria miniovina TaxID=1954250 RepID=A0AA40B3L3_9PEZI|nr:uncharacterized protein B0T26DRAFT_110185 [Lasiosphaeria miniovina]KAK0726960.1 hypothetical protein B0T26DRAFT_110185 [Lasiosphaeria miniovina]